MRSRKRKASTASWILFGMRWRHRRTLSRLCFDFLTDKVLHPQYRGLMADSRWPVPPHPSSRCSSSIWRAKLWIPPPSSTWWWKTTRLLGKISKCNACWAGRYAYFWHSVAKCVSCLYTAQRVAVWSGCASSRSRCSSWLVVSLASVSTR